MGKISGYGEDTSPTVDDFLPTVDTTSGANKKVKLGSLRSVFNTKRVTSIASSSSPTPNSTTDDVYQATALAVNHTFGAPTGTPSDGQVMTLRWKDNGTSRTTAWNAIYVPIGVTLPTSTTANKWNYAAIMYDALDTAWHVLSIGRQS